MFIVYETHVDENENNITYYVDKNNVAHYI